MKHTAAKLIRALCGMVVMLVLAASITSVPARAADNGIYIAAATSHYRHPITGEIEDAGGDGSAVLGQSMTESALYPEALVEVDPQGNTYVTIRLKLMDNIEDPQFQVDGDWVSADLMQEDYSVNTADYRMYVYSEYSVIRCNMYVVPMGREVIFYITVSDLTPGSDDFITSVTVEEPEPQPQETEAPAPAPAETTRATEAPRPSTAPGTQPTEGSTEASSAPAETVKPPESKPAAGLQEYDASGNPVENTEPAPAQADESSALPWILGGLGILLAAGACVWYFCVFRKKK